MDPRQNKRIKVKSTAARTEKGKQTMASGFHPPQPPKRPRTTSSIAHQQAPQLRNDLRPFSRFKICLWSLS